MRWLALLLVLAASAAQAQDLEAERARARDGYNRATRAVHGTTAAIRTESLALERLRDQELELRAETPSWSRDRHLEDVREKLALVSHRVVRLKLEHEAALADVQVRRLVLLEVLDRQVAKTDDDLTLERDLLRALPAPEPPTLPVPSMEGLQPDELEDLSITYAELAREARAGVVALEPRRLRLERVADQLATRVAQGALDLEPQLEGARADLAALEVLIARERARAADHGRLSAMFDAAANRGLGRGR